MRRSTTVILLALLCGTLAFAQERTSPPRDEDEREPARSREAEPRERSEIEELRERVRRAMRLPRTTEEAREAGAPEERVREVLRTGRERGVPAGEMEQILEEENRHLREGGEKQNFGAAVQQMKQQGLRGRELAAAIHAEQVARGMKKADHPGKGKAQGHGRPGSARDDAAGPGRGKRERDVEPGEEELETGQQRIKEKGKVKEKGKAKGEAGNDAKGKDRERGPRGRRDDR